MSTPGISLIIPAYNAGRYLREAIDSVLNQTVRPRQVIVIDDGSTDDTLAVACGFGDALTVITQKNGDVSAARNRGLLEADQPLITFLDADDRLAPRKIERQLEALLGQPDAMLCLCRACDFWSPEMPDAARRSADFAPQFRPGQPQTWLVRREVFDRVGTFNTSPDFTFSEGSELYSRIENAGLGMVRIDDVLVQRRLHASNKTADARAHLDGIMVLMKRRLELRRDSA
jgi:glycosyltransferase involved in cell wall biosynthesis